MFYKGEVPFVRLLIPLIAGIAAGWLCPSEWIIRYVTPLFLILLTLFILLIANFKNKSVLKRRWLPGIIFHTILFFIGYYNIVYQSGSYSSVYFSNKKADALVVKITGEPRITGEVLRFESDVLQTVFKNRFNKAEGKLLIALKIDTQKTSELNYGDVLLIPSVYNEVEPPYNPGEFNFKFYLKTRLIRYQSFIHEHDYKLIKQNEGNPVISYALQLRKTLVKKFHTYLPDKESASMASTLILGYRADLSKEIINAYSKTGTMHVLSVSGMHVGIVFLVLNFLLKPLSRNQRTKLLRALIIIAVIWFYSLITGFSPSVCRAALMLTFIVMGKALQKNLNTYNLLAISAFILLLYNPLFILDVGFQLSYLAVIGLIYLHPKIYHSYAFKNKILDEAWSYCALSIAAQLATFPISIYYFHQFPVYFLFSNLFIVLPVALIMYGGILFLFIPFDLILKPLGIALSWLIDFTNQILYYIENFPYSSLSGIWISTAQYLLIYLVIGCAIWSIRLRSKTAAVLTLMGTMVFTAGVGYRSVINHNRNELIFYSLRKNSAMAYIHHGRCVMVSDLTTADKTMSFSVEPALNSMGYSDYQLLKPEEKVSNTFFSLNGHFMQYAGYKVLRWDKEFNSTRFISRIEVDALLLSGNPAISIDQLKKQVKFSILLIDGTNPDYKLKRWLADAESQKINYYVLKKNAAYVVKL